MYLFIILRIYNIYIYNNLTFVVKQIYYDMKISFQRKDILEARCSIIIARHAKQNGKSWPRFPRDSQFKGLNCTTGTIGVQNIRSEEFQQDFYHVKGAFLHFCNAFSERYFSWVANCCWGVKKKVKQTRRSKL